MQDNHTIPYGYCHCGCGQKTKIARQSMTDRGHVNGEPLRFIHGHNTKSRFTVDPDAQEKACTKCGETKPLNEFGNHKKTRDGKNCWCKKCHREYHRAYYRSISDDHYERTVRWRRNNPEAVRAIKQRRRAAEKGSYGGFDAEDWKEILTRYQNRCLCCGVSGGEEKLTADHVVPLSKGGSHDASNIQPLCHSCNSRKGTKIIDYR